MKKTMFKRSICIFISLIMLLGAVAVARTDIPRSEIPSAESIAQRLNRIGIMLGTENGFELERSVTRAEALTLIWRTSGLAFTDIGISNPFADVSTEHWAYDTILKFYHAGYIHGTSETTFEPERTVTGREFAKIMLSCMGYEDVTIENAYDIGEASEFLSDNFTSTIVYNDFELTRDECARLCFSALTTFTPEPDRKMVYKRLIENGTHEEDDFYGVLYAGSPAAKVPSDEFGDKLTEHMPKDKNYMISPLSIKMALALVANGANGATQQEILDACGIDDIDAFNQASKEMIEKYSKADVLRLDIANSLWINEDRSPLEFNDTYTSKMDEFFGAALERVNNSNAVEKINSWANEKTNGKIPTIINNNEFWTYLANAVYFKAGWENEFSKYATGPDIFTDRNGKESTIDFMNETSYMSYYRNYNNSVRAVKLDYRNIDTPQNEDGSFSVERYDDIDVSMYVILANEENFAPVQAVKNMQFETEYIKFSMPKFELKFEMKPHEVLRKMGVKAAFDEKTADFTPMVNGDGMCIIDSVHKTYIKVDEEGTEAAAVTGFAGGTASVPNYPEPIEFDLDKPFYYVIMDNINGEALFMGEFAFVE